MERASDFACALWVNPQVMSSSLLCDTIRDDGVKVALQSPKLSISVRVGVVLPNVTYRVLLKRLRGCIGNTLDANSVRRFESFILRHMDV